jgi:ubiquinone biosynthesis protein
MLLWANITRFASIVAVLIRHGITYLLEPPVRRPERLRKTFEELGGAYIKFGQMLALQPDILSLEYCDALFSLLDRVAPFGFDRVETTCLEEWGRRPSEVFDCIDPAPLATASIGQVHVAWLQGRKLAVKVQRPTVQRDFAGDIQLMTAAIRMIKTLRLRALSWMIEPMSEFVAWTREELDYRHEARYMEQLRRNACENPNEHVPAVLDEFTTRRTLVMEFLEGQTVLGYLRALENGDRAAIEDLEAGGFESHLVASHIIDNFLGDVFQHGVFHADLHPANLMILPGNVVGYIDFGITGTISSYSRQNLVALTLAYTRGDLSAMCEAFFRVSAIDSHSNIERFQQGLNRDAKSWYRSEGKEVRLRKNFTLVMLDMLRLSRDTGIWPERDVIKYIRSAIAIDGLITRFAPTFDLGRHLQMVCSNHLKWHARRKLFSMHHLINWTSAAGRMMQDGGLRAFSALNRLSGGGIEQLGVSAGDRSNRLARKSRYFAGVLAISCFAASLSPQPAHIGMNLFTAEAGLAAAGFLLLVGSVGKLSGGG